MPISDWSRERLLDARNRGDEGAEALLAALKLTPGHGRMGYNYLLRVMDWVVQAPALLEVKGSALEQRVRAVPEAFLHFFAPQPLPDWVDASKLDRAAKIWEENTLSLLMVLYVASLPACYLLHRGIPALYRTQKLSNRRYLPQRLFETGLMLDAVLDEDGLRIQEDHADRFDQVQNAALRACELDSEWVWKDELFVRRDGRPGTLEGEDAVRLTAAAVHLSGAFRGRRFVSGRGLLAARKVRVLHAYMRAMLLAEPAGVGAGAWDLEKDGMPVNQEDQAYTLLTFGYVMMVGLERLGRRLSREDREAFLHRWRLVGHLMGIEDWLMTDQWDEARYLFERIRDTESGSSPEGHALTRTLVAFLEDLLPHDLRINRLLVVPLVEDQMRSLGADPELLLPPVVALPGRSPLARVLCGLLRLWLWAYFRIREMASLILPGVSSVVRQAVHPLTEDLIDSFASGFVRRPFYLPAQLNTWALDPGADEAFREQLRRWRRELFLLVLMGAFLLMSSAFCFVGGFVLAGFQRWPMAAVGWGAGVVIWWVFGELARGWVPALRARRPRPNVGFGPTKSEKREGATA